MVMVSDDGDDGDSNDDSEDDDVFNLEDPKYAHHPHKTKHFSRSANHKCVLNMIQNFHNFVFCLCSCLCLCVCQPPMCWEPCLQFP